MSFKILLLGNSHAATYLLAAKKLYPCLSRPSLSFAASDDIVIDFAGATSNGLDHLECDDKKHLFFPAHAIDRRTTFGSLKTNSIDANRYRAVSIIGARSPLSYHLYSSEPNTAPPLSKYTLIQILKRAELNHKVFRMISRISPCTVRVPAPAAHRGHLGRGYMVESGSKARLQKLQYSVVSITNNNHDYGIANLFLQPLETLDDSLIGTQDKYMRLDSPIRVWGGVLEEHPTDYNHATEEFGLVMLPLLVERIRKLILTGHANQR
jgi:hypothetical protein